MRVLIVNTSEKTGGAAIAANRLMEALMANGVKVKMLVRDKQTDNINVVAVPRSLRLRWNFVWERAVIWMRNAFSRRNLWQVDIANAGTDITLLPEFQEADVIHLHWVNQGFLSMSGIRKIVQSGKRVVWTLHDQWPYTGICHYTEGCTRYEEQCHDCPLLARPGRKDLSQKLFAQKLDIYRSIFRITFVGCSQWITDLARQSALLKAPASQREGREVPGLSVVHIPNAINQAVFRPSDKAAARRRHGLPAEGRLLLFSSLKVTDERKGIAYLIEACRLLAQQPPYAPSTAPGTERESLGIVVVGKQAEAMAGQFPFPLYSIPYISDEAQMALLYSAVDAFVTPSLQDNLPNTIVEAMSVGTPCVGFRVGGIPEMIHHLQDGYVAEARDAADLARGIAYVLSPEHAPALSKAAAAYAAKTYSPSRVARLYADVYSGSIPASTTVGR